MNFIGPFEKTKYQGIQDRVKKLFKKLKFKGQWFYCKRFLPYFSWMILLFTTQWIVLSFRDLSVSWIKQ